MNILLIDDDKLSLTSLRKALQLHGFLVDAFEDPRQAIQSYRRIGHELVFSDLTMDKYDGLEMIDHLRQMANPQTRIVLFTEYSTDRLKKIAVDIGAHGFYQKPIPLEDLINLANEVLSLTTTESQMNIKYGEENVF